jgi:hypothetical protein
LITLNVHSPLKTGKKQKYDKEWGKTFVCVSRTEGRRKITELSKGYMYTSDLHHMYDMCIVEIIFNIYSYMLTSQFQYVCVSSTDGETDGAYEII